MFVGLFLSNFCSDVTNKPPQTNNTSKKQTQNYHKHKSNTKTPHTQPPQTNIKPPQTNLKPPQTQNLHKHRTPTNKTQKPINKYKTTTNGPKTSTNKQTPQRDIKLPLYLPASDGRVTRKNPKDEQSRRTRRAKHWRWTTTGCRSSRKTECLSSDDNSFRSCSYLVATVSPAQRQLKKS